MSDKTRDLESLIRAFRVIAETYQRVADHLESHQSVAGTNVWSRLDPLKRQVLATTVPEIYTSLTALKGALYILLFEEPADPEACRALLTRAHDHAEKVMALMNDYLMWISN